MILIGGRIFVIFWPLEMSNFDKPRPVNGNMTAAGNTFYNF